MTGQWFMCPVTERLRKEADDLERRARVLRELADSVESPPEGVTVEYDGHDTLRFVGPSVTVNRQEVVK